MSERIVIDTSTLVSVVLNSKSVPRLAYEKAAQSHVVLLSVPIELELNDVFSREKFDKYVSRFERLTFLATLIRQCEVVDVTTTIRECRDPKDDKFLELAVDGYADFIISSDDDLLVLHPFRGIQIMTPRTFLDLELT
jgi:putative PIN family toxin of toxin-antitoxin system